MKARKLSLFAVLVLGFGLIYCGLAFSADMQFVLDGKALKTKPARASAIAPLRDALIQLDQQIDANGGKMPADVADRLKKIQSLASGAKSEIRSLAQNLQSAGEVEQFNTLALGEAKKISAKLAAEIQGAGGAHALLLKSESLIDQDITSRLAAAKSASLFDMLFGVSTAEASIRSTACAGFWFVLSFGYGDEFAYKSCYA